MRRTAPRVVAAALLTVGLCVPAGELRADPDVEAARATVPRGDVDDELAERAREAYALGLALSAQGQLAAALGEFSRSLELLPHPRTRYNVAYCELGLERYTRARDQFRVAKADPKLDPVLAAQAEAYLAKIETQLGRVVLASDAPEHRLRIDGRPLKERDGEWVAGLAPRGPGAPMGSTRLEAVIDPGHHEAVWEGSVGGTPFERSLSFDVAPGQSASLRLVAPSPPPPAPEPPTSPLPPRVVPAPWPGPAVAPPPQADGTAPWVVTGLSVAGLGVVVGGVTGALALAAKSDAESQCIEGFCPPATQADIDRADRLAVAADVSFAVGAVGGVMALVAWLVSDDGDVAAAGQGPPWGFHARF